MAYLLDTNIFNQLLDGRISVTNLPSDGKLTATSIQLQEIKNTKCDFRRDELLQIFDEISAETVSVQSSIWGVTPWGEGRFGGQSNLYNLLLAELDAMNNAKANNYADALTAEVVLVKNQTLITADQDLANLVETRGGKLIRFPP